MRSRLLPSLLSPVGCSLLLAAAVSAAPTFTSNQDQYLFVGDPPTPMAAVTITDDPATPEITAANDLRIRIPVGFNMTWDPSDSVAVVLGGAASKVSTTVTFEDADRTAVLDVTADFAASDQVIVSGLLFANFTAASPFDNLELEVLNDGLVTVEDPRTKSVITPISTRSTAIALTPDGQEVWVVNPDHGTVSVIATQGGSANTLLAEIPVGRQPWTVALHPWNGEAWVTSLEDDGVWIVDVATRTVTDSISLGYETFGVAFNPQGSIALVTSSGSDEVFAVDVGTRAIVQTLATYRRPRGIAWREDGARAWVSHLLMPEFFGRLTTIFESTWTKSEILIQQVFGLNVAGYPSVMQNLTLAPGDSLLWIPNSMLHTSNGQLFGNPLSPTNLAHAVVRPVNITTSTDLPASTYFLSESGTDVSGPIAVDFKGGRAYVANLNSDNVTVLTQNIFSASEVAVVPVGRAPIGVVAHPTIGRVYVANWLSRDVSVINSSTQAVIATVGTVGSEILPPQILNGKQLFFSSSAAESLSLNDRVACATCHVFATHDSRPWDLSQFGKHIRATPDIRGIGFTGAHDWTADKDEMQDHNFGILEFAGGPGLLPGGGNPALGAPNAGLSLKMDDIGRFMATLTHRTDTPFGPSAAADSGEVLFNDPVVACATCHVPPFFTDSDAVTLVKHDVGTADPGDTDGAAGYDTPSLIGVWDTGPYLHTALATTLQSVMTTWNPSDQHGTTSHLSPTQIDFIAEYLKTIAWPGSTGTAVDAPVVAAASGELESPFPNPFAENTSLRFTISGGTARVRMDVFDVQGRRVRQLLDRDMARGAHTVGWDSRDDSGVRVAPGVYFARYSVDGAAAGGKKMVVLR